MEIICKQKDGFSMGLSLGPVLLNIIMTELEKLIVEPLITSGKTNFYIRCVDDTLLLANKEDTMFTFDKSNLFNKNLKFTIDCFDDNNIHFYILQLTKTKLIYTRNPLILVNILTLTAMCHVNLKFHRLNRFTTEQRKFVHQANSSDFKLKR